MENTITLSILMVNIFLLDMIIIILGCWLFSKEMGSPETHKSKKTLTFTLAALLFVVVCLLTGMLIGINLNKEKTPTKPLIEKSLLVPDAGREKESGKIVKREDLRQTTFVW